MAKLMELQQQIDEEVRKRRAVEQQLLEAREELKQIPPLQEALMQCKQTMLKYVEKGVAASSLGNIRTVCRDILTEWRRLRPRSRIACGAACRTWGAATSS
ncbi:unnamed protein product [Effrenium voratum]|nr:unnamed protein product [Effrenium voratum]